MPDEIPQEVLRRLLDRRALLWLCQAHDLIPGESRHGLGDDLEKLRSRYRSDLTDLDRRIASFHWEAIVSDSARGLIGEAVHLRADEEAARAGARVRRPIVLAADPEGQGQINTREFIPIYFPLGLLDRDQLDERYDAPPLRRLSYRMNHLRKLSSFPGRVLVILGANGQEDVDVVLEALAEFAPVGMVVLLIWPTGVPTPHLPDMPTPVYVWHGTTAEFLSALEAQEAPRAESVGQLRIRVGRRTVTLSEADILRVDERFLVLKESDIEPLDESEVTRPVLENFLKAVDGDWRGYRGGLAFARRYHAGSGQDLAAYVLTQLEGLRSVQGNGENLTVTLPAEGGSGATTLLRTAAFQVAKAGHPTLVLKADEIDFNREELAAFLTRLAEEARVRLRLRSDPVALIVFDREHETIDTTRGFAQFLAMRGRPAVVLRAESCQAGRAVDEDAVLRLRVRGRKLQLPPLTAEATDEEVEGLCEHFRNLAVACPLGVEAPTLDEWRDYQARQILVSPGGTQEAESLFWVALHFFLFHRGEQMEEASDWVRRIYFSIEDPKLLEAVRRVAAFSSLGLMVPLMPLARSLGDGSRIDMDLVRGLASIDEESGLIRWESSPLDLEDQALRFRHRLLAEIVIRTTDAAIADFPIQVTWPVLETLVGGVTGDLWLADNLAYQVLRTERRDTRSVHDLQAIVESFQRFPPHVSEGSKTVLHHWARALYHLGCREEDHIRGNSYLTEAAEMLERAIELPSRPGRGEHPGHLLTTLGTVHAELHKRYLRQDEQSRAELMWRKATRAFDKALSLVSDSFVALVAYAYRLSARAEELKQDPSAALEPATTALAYLTQAEDISRDTGELSQEDEEWIATCRNHVWAVLAPDVADRQIRDLKARDEPLGYLLEAQGILSKVDLTRFDERNRPAMEKATAILDQAVRLPSQAISWRILYLLYRLYTVNPERQSDSAARLGLLRRLEHTDFNPHLRIHFDFAVLCYQRDLFAEGRDRFRKLRDLINQRAYAARRFSDFWRDHRDPRSPRAGTLRVTRVFSNWRAYGSIAEMNGQEVLLRPRHFEVPPDVGDYRQCHVRFETSGPIAVPTSFPVERT